MPRAAKSRPPSEALADYDTDAFGWSQQQARFLREGRFDRLDIKNLADEIEDVGKSEKRELKSSLRVILLHILKWDYQDSRRSRSWVLSILAQRELFRETLADNRGLRPHVPALLGDAYRVARIEAARETGLPLDDFPEVCPYDIDTILNRPFETTP